jgi:leucyl/phenylalanyl-tRNA---protein transferase
MAQNDAQDSPADPPSGRLTADRRRRPSPELPPPRRQERLDPDLVLSAYRVGVCPMDGPDGLHWYRPEPRALIPLDERFHVPASLARVMRQGRFAVRTDTAFEAVMRACAARAETWISAPILAAYADLHRRGVAHSVECYDGDGILAGGLYGVALGGAFFGESMFSRARDASKVALVHLVERLRRGGFVLLDTQFLTPHLARFGAYTVPRRTYEALLAAALAVDARWERDTD